MHNKRFHFIFILSAFTLVSLFYSCEKDPEIIIQTETITDTLIITDTLTIVDTLIETIIETVSDTATTFILVKHAEKATTGGTNPELTDAGHARAIELSRILGNLELNAIFSTNYHRTTQTAAPTAENQDLSIQFYDPFNLDPFVDNALVDYHEGIILVIGHSNITPFLLNLLVGEDIYPQLEESDHDNIYIVTVFEKGRASVVHMKYGE